MSSSSGGDSRTSKSPAPTKVKTHVTSHRGPDSNWQAAISKKNARKLNNSSNSTSSPTSPVLQQINEITPLLTTSNSAFNYDKPLPVTTTSSDMVVDDLTVIDNTNEPINSNLSVSISTPTGSNVIKNPLRHNLQSFPSDYTGPIFILVESTDTGKNLGKWHPVGAAKFFSNNFNGIINIKPAGFKKVKITFDSIEYGNLCLNSAFLKDYSFSASIPSNLIYSFGVIKLDTDFSEADSMKAYLRPFKLKASDGLHSKRMAILHPLAWLN